MYYNIVVRREVGLLGPCMHKGLGRLLGVLVGSSLGLFWL